MTRPLVHPTQHTPGITVAACVQHAVWQSSLGEKLQGSGVSGRLVSE